MFRPALQIKTAEAAAELNRIFKCQAANLSSLFQQLAACNLHRAALKEPFQVVINWVKKLRSVSLLQARELNFPTPTHTTKEGSFGAALYCRIIHCPTGEIAGGKRKGSWWASKSKGKSDEANAISLLKMGTLINLFYVGTDIQKFIFEAQIVDIAK